MSWNNKEETLLYLYRPDLFKTDIFRNFTIGNDGNLPVFIEPFSR